VGSVVENRNLLFFKASIPTKSDIDFGLRGIRDPPPKQQLHWLPTSIQQRQQVAITNERKWE
jgi:hypothetical protein